MSRNIGSVEEAAGKTGHAAEQISISSEELSKQATLLKHQMTNFLDQIQNDTGTRKLAEWDGLEERAEQLAAELAQIDKRLLDLGGQLTRRRQQAIPRLNREVSQHLEIGRAHV